MAVSKFAICKKNTLLPGSLESTFIGPQTDCRFELGDRPIAVTSLQQGEPRLLCVSGLSGCCFTA